MNQQHESHENCLPAPCVAHTTDFPTDATAEGHAGSPPRHGTGAGGAALPTSSSGSPLSSNELLRRLRETQALLIKFSEENSRLARDNEQLQARNALLHKHTALPACDLCVQMRGHPVLKACRNYCQLAFHGFGTPWLAWCKLIY